MTTVSVQKVMKSDDRKLPVFEEMDRLLTRIRERAFWISNDHEFDATRTLDDWLAAEREICWPSTELVERPREFSLAVALPGFEPSDLTVTATPRELIVHAKSEKSRDSKTDDRTVWSEFRSNDVYRRVELPAEIDPPATTATLKNGLLTVVAAKAEKPSRAVPISAAA